MSNDIARVDTFKDVYGCTATITESTSGKANLAIRNNRGNLIYAKTYDSYLGAKIAMGKTSDGWRKQ